MAFSWEQHMRAFFTRQQMRSATWCADLIHNWPYYKQGTLISSVVQAMQDDEQWEMEKAWKAHHAGDVSAYEQAQLWID